MIHSNQSSSVLSFDQLPHRDIRNTEQDQCRNFKIQIIHDAAAEEGKDCFCFCRTRQIEKIRIKQEIENEDWNGDNVHDKVSE